MQHYNGSLTPVNVQPFTHLKFATIVIASSHPFNIIITITEWHHPIGLFVYWKPEHRTNGSVFNCMEIFVQIHDPLWIIGLGNLNNI